MSKKSKVTEDDIKRVLDHIAHQTEADHRAVIKIEPDGSGLFGYEKSDKSGKLLIVVEGSTEWLAQALF